MIGAAPSPAPIRVAGERMACVVDARLVFSRLGLLTVARLARELHVWLPREVRGILQDPRTYLEEPQRLVPRVYCATLRNLDPRTEAHAVSQELSQWNRLPDEDELAALPLYHLGERADECATPACVDRSLRERYEQLLRGLDLCMRRSDYDLGRGSAFAACVRDTVALCAALQPYGAFILTRMEPDGEGAPALCDYLDAWDVPVEKAPQGARSEVQPLRDAMSRAGLGPIDWAGVGLAAAHVVLPGFPVLGGPDKGLADDAVARLWSRAPIFWHRIWE